jgi:hypothetical protein
VPLPHVPNPHRRPRAPRPRTLPALALAAALLVAPGAAAAFPRSGVVTPTRFGDLRSGMKPAKVTALWGAPRTISRTKGNPFSSFAYGRGVQRIVVSFYANRLDDVVTLGPGWKLDGIAPGSSWRALRAALPTASCMWNQEDDFADGCLYGASGNASLHAHRIYFAGPRKGPVRSIHLITNHAD